MTKRFRVLWLGDTLPPAISSLWEKRAAGSVMVKIEAESLSASERACLENPDGFRRSLGHAIGWVTLCYDYAAYNFWWRIQVEEKAA